MDPVTVNLPDIRRSYNLTMDPDSPSQPTRLLKFKQSLNDINFTSLKQRHDNFSFDRAIEARPQVYDSIHFKSHRDEYKPHDILVFPKKLPGIQKVPDEEHHSFARILSNSSIRVESQNQDEEILWRDFKAHF
jgi:hypothetical protein